MRHDKTFYDMTGKPCITETRTAKEMIEDAIYDSFPHETISYENGLLIVNLGGNHE